MMKNNNLIKVIVYALLLTATLGIGYVGGLFESMYQVFASIHLNPAVLVRLAVMVFAVMLVKNILVLILSAMTIRNKRGSTMRSVTDSLTRYISAIVVICWGLRILGVDVATIVASVGIIALVVGFGAESLVADMITGLFVLFENQYNVGDIIEVNGFRGTISSIGIRTTVLTDAGGNVKIFNNSDMKDILNRSDNLSKAIVKVGVSYDINLEDLEAKLPEMLEDIYQKHTDVMKAVPVYMGVAELAESSVVLQFCVDVQESNIYSVMRIMNHDLFVAFQKAKVEIPFNQLVVTQK